MGDIGRRGFLKRLGIGAAALTAGMALDPERALWVPGAKSLFLPPERSLIQVKTMEQALSYGLAAVWPDGSEMTISLAHHMASESWGGGSWAGLVGTRPLPLEERIRLEINAVEAMGGKVVRAGDLLNRGGWHTSKRGKAKRVTLDPYRQRIITSGTVQV